MKEQFSCDRSYYNVRISTTNELTFAELVSYAQLFGREHLLPTDVKYLRGIQFTGLKSL